MRQLILLRHAVAEEGHGKRDFDRELTPQGRKDATRMGQWLAEAGLRPDLVVSSPAPRAFETAKLAGQELGTAPGQVRTDPTLYDCTLAALLHNLGKMPASAKRILLVGHNPGLGQLALHLTGDEDLARFGLAKAGVVALDLPDDWRALGAQSAQAWNRAQPSAIR